MVLLATLFNHKKRLNIWSIGKSLHFFQFDFFIHCYPLFDQHNFLSFCNIKKDQEIYVESVLKFNNQFISNQSQ